MRLYRSTLTIVVLGIVVVMFSLVSRPSPLPMDLATEPFDETGAAATTHRLVSAAPERSPGSDGDRDALDFLRQEFESLEGGSLISDRFPTSYEHRRVELENLIYSLPGETDDVVVVSASRDCRVGPCAASSGASSGALIELARTMSRTQRRKTMLFVSTDGSVAGSAGTKRLAEYLDGRSVIGAIVLLQAGTADARGRHVVPWSISSRATSAQLTRTARAAVESELEDAKEPLRGTGSELVRLAIPAGLGEQGPMIAAGLDAVSLSGGGDHPLQPAEDETFSAETLGMIGRSALNLIQALDRAPEQLEAGPSARIPLSGKFVPGWALWLLALTMLLPLAAAALEVGVRARQRDLPLGSALLWAASRCLPFLIAVGLLYLLALVRLVPAPPFPFDPALYPLDLKAALALVLVLAGLLGTQVELERRFPAGDLGPTGSAAISIMIFITGVCTFVVSPYLALLLLPPLHLTLIALGPWGGRALRLALLAVALFVPVVVLDALGRQLGVGWGEAIWQLGLMFTGGQFGPLAGLPGVLAAGTLTATLHAVLSGWTNMRQGPLRVQAPSRRYRGQH